MDVGRHTFALLGRVELVFVGAVALAATLSPAPASVWRLVVQVPALIVVAQMFWLRPRLAVRTRHIIEGADPPSSPLHVVFIGSEALKLCSLLALAILIR
ncbi:MAG: hypothetical protein ACREFQ_11115 [Stellaceae bacterium]